MDETRIPCLNMFVLRCLTLTRASGLLHWPTEFEHLAALFYWPELKKHKELYDNVRELHAYHTEWSNENSCVSYALAQKHAPKNEAGAAAFSIVVALALFYSKQR